MSIKNFNTKARKPAEEPQVDAYHVHIYFEKGAASEIDALRTAKAIDELFPGAVEDLHRVGRVGPHTELNIGVTITAESFGKVVSWLQVNNPGLSILIHPRTGDEWNDHINCSMWLGKPVPYNMAFFEPFRPQAPKGPSGPSM